MSHLLATDAKSLRIGIAIETDGPGGAEAMVLGLAEELRILGHHVLAIGPTEGEGWLSAGFRERSFDRESVAFGGRLDWRVVRSLSRIVRQQNLDVLHSHEFAMAVFGSLATLRSRCGHVITMHGGLHFAERWRRRVALRAAVGLSNETVSVSHFSRDRLSSALSISPVSLHVVHNGVTPTRGDPHRIREELAIGDGDVFLLAVGNLYPVKGHRYLIEAIAALHGSTQVVVGIAGRGEEARTLKSHASALGVEDKLRFLGFRNDIPSLLAAADIFVMPSLSEGLPMAVIEAMLAGKAIVGTDVGGIPELISDGLEGQLVPPAEPARLAAALAALLQDPQLRNRLGRAAMRKARQEFSAHAMARKYVALYRTASRPPPIT